MLFKNSVLTVLVALAALAAQAHCKTSGNVKSAKSRTTHARLNVGSAAKSGKSYAVGITEKKIVGGYSVASATKTTKSTSYPFMVHIGIQSGSKYNSQCGGTVLDKRHVLTAAHCVTNRSLQYRVRAGSLTWAAGGQLVKVAKIASHPEYYKAAAYDYDVAVLRLAKDLALGAEVQPVSLVPVNQALVTGTNITVIGWGYTDKMRSDPLPNTLQEVQLAVIDHSECEGDYSNDKLTITDRMFCGMTPTGEEQDTCQGDSGGPVIVTDKKTKKYEQIGVISWGMGCAMLSYPGVYVNLANPAIRSFIAQEQKA